MDKLLYKKMYALFQDVLMIERITKGISQEILAKKLNRPQSYISKVEGGSRSKKSRNENWRVGNDGKFVTKSIRKSKKESMTRRIDVIELLEYCQALGLTLTDFAMKVEGRLFAEGYIKKTPTAKRLSEKMME